MPPLGNRRTVRGYRPPTIRAAPEPRRLPAPSAAQIQAAGEPFGEALYRGQRRIEALAPRLTPPHIPIVAKPTPRQVQAAHEIAVRYEHSQLPRHRTAADITAFRESLASTPRGRAYNHAVAHYLGHGQKMVQEAALSKLPLSALEQGVGQREPARAEPRSFGPSKPNLPFGLPGATINLGPLLTSIANAHIIPGSNIASKIANEVFDLPAQSFLTGAQVGTGLHEGLESGNWSRLKGIGSGIEDQATHPIRSLKEAPLSTALLAGGAENLVGRLAGKAGRAGLAGPRVAEAFSTKRGDLKLYNGEAIQGRHYNADPLRKAAQVAYEQGLTKLPEGEIRLGSHSSGKLRQRDPFQAEGLRLKRAMTGGIVKAGQVDYIRPAGERTRRAFVKPNVAKLEAARPASGEDAAALIAQGIVKPHAIEADLRKEAARLKAAQQGTNATAGKPLVGVDLAANKESLARVKALLADKEFLADPQAAIAASETYKGLLGPLTAKRVTQGSLLPEQLRAALYPYAQAHMGASRYTPEGKLLPTLYADGKPLSNEAILQHMADNGVGMTEAESEALRVAAHHEGLAKQGPARIAAAERIVAAARAKEKLPRLTALERRPGTGPEGTAATKAADRLVQTIKDKHGVKDLREVPSLAEAEAHLRRTRAFAAQSTQFARVARQRALGISLATQRVAHVSHTAGIQKGSSFYKATTRMPTLEGYERTGAALEKGTADHSFEAMKGSLANNASKVAQAEVRARELNRVTVGRFDTRAQAEKAAGNLATTPEGDRVAQGLGKWIPVQLGPKQILDRGAVNPGDLNKTLRQFGLSEHTPVARSDAGKWALIPEKVQHRFEAHDNAVSARGEGKRLAQRYVQGFRRAKLYTSTRHAAGVAQELGIRLFAEGVAPRALGGRYARLGRNLRQHFEALAEDQGPLGAHYRELNDALGSRGSLYTSTQDNDIVRKGNLWQRTSAKGAPTPAKAWRAYYKTLQEGMHKVEQGAYDPLLGKAVAEFFDHWKPVLKLQDEGMRRLENMTPAEADSIARRVDDMMGNWSHQPPEVRRAVQTWSPFGLWWLNSMRWLYRLPVTHPIKTAIAAALYNATRKERNEEGQGYDSAHPVPGFLTGTINATLPLVGRVKLNPAYYSPMGVATEPTVVAAEQIFPQLNSAYAAAREQNPLTGEKLTNAKGAPVGPLGDIANFLSAVATGPLPGATQLEQGIQRGGKPLGTANLVTDLIGALGGPSQTKPNTQRPTPEVLMKMLFPARFDFPRAGAGGGTGKSLPGGSARDTMIERRISEALKRRSSLSEGRIQRRIDETLAHR